jgi:hypothetical protein
MRIIFDIQIDLIVDLLKDQVAQLIGKDKYRKIVITMLSFRDLLQESLASIEGIPNSVRRLWDQRISLPAPENMAGK